MPGARRIVTGIGENGRSRVVRDGAATCSLELAPGLRLTDLWETTREGDDGRPSHDGAARPLRLEPPAGGSILRLIDYPPDREWRSSVKAGHFFESMGAGAALKDGGKDALMHRTDTIDYIIVLEGEIYAILEDGETRLTAGDVLIQRGTTHSWENRSDAICRMAAILVSTAPSAPVNRSQGEQP